MEVEAKLEVDDDGVLEHLARAPALAGYVLTPVAARIDRDVFLDTQDGRLLAAGVYLRLRRNDRGRRLVLKQVLPGAPDGVLRRDEVEAPLVTPQPDPLAALPVAAIAPGALAAQVAALCGDASLVPVLALRQERRTRRAVRGGSDAAEVSLDRVTVVEGGRPVGEWREVEVELLADGRDADLERLAGALRRDWGLRPSRLSKFERALALLGRGAVGT